MLFGDLVSFLSCGVKVVLCKFGFFCFIVVFVFFECGIRVIGWGFFFFCYLRKCYKLSGLRRFVGFFSRVYRVCLLWGVRGSCGRRWKGLDFGVYGCCSRCFRFAFFFYFYFELFSSSVGNVVFNRSRLGFFFTFLLFVVCRLGR